MKTWIIVADGSRSLAAVGRDLEVAGLKELQTLGEIGCLTGQAEPELLERLRAVAGVADISESGPIELPPPGSPETWST